MGMVQTKSRQNPMANIQSKSAVLLGNVKSNAALSNEMPKFKNKEMEVTGCAAGEALRAPLSKSRLWVIVGVASF